MKILVDMNLSPSWAQALREEGFEAVHWSAVGDGRATDAELLAWADANDHVVFTHDQRDAGLLNKPISQTRHRKR
ncbi:MAG: DUF5615 family PIN-like protein [Gammaproteobacteria bacterium]|nr:MAG: DUF5615 family PIN-like protein [Gammaproteobacteria bacterium]